MALFLLRHPPDCGFQGPCLRGGPEFENHAGLWPMCRRLRGCGQY